MFLTVAALALPAAAQTTRYFRQGATGNNSGADWTNACPGFTGACAISNLPRPSKVCVAEGYYGSIDLNKANSGTSLISIVRAINSLRDPADTYACRTAVGWNDSFGDGQASFDSVFFTTDFWLLDGVVRNESNPPFSWNAETRTEYGFRVSQIFSNTAVNGNCAEEVTIRYVDLGKAYSTTYNTPTQRGIIHLDESGTAPCKNWLVQRVFIHNTNESLNLAGTDGFTLEYSWLGLAWSKEIIRGQVTARNVTIRFNWFENGCRNDGSGSDPCTAEIAFFANQGQSDDFEGFRAYGNVLYKTLVQQNTNGCILAAASDAKVFNNTIVHYGSTGLCDIVTHAGGELRNNIWFLPNGITSGCGGGTCSDNSAYTSNPPFVNVDAANLHLTSALPGAVLSSPFDMDMRSTKRGADGAFDRGAFEFVRPSPPTNLRSP
jgi:hypothetical protein